MEADVKIVLCSSVWGVLQQTKKENVSSVYEKWDWVEYFAIFYPSPCWMVAFRKEH